MRSLSGAVSRDSIASYRSHTPEDRILEVAKTGAAAWLPPKPVRRSVYCVIIGGGIIGGIGATPGTRLRVRSPVLSNRYAPSAPVSSR